MMSFRSTLLAAAAIVASVHGAWAGSVTYSHDTAPAKPNFTDTFTLPSFNTALGGLTGVTITVQGSGTVSVGIVNLAGVDISYTDATADFPTTIAASNGAIAKLVISAGPFSGTAASNGAPYTLTTVSGLPVNSIATATINPSFYSTFEGSAGATLSFSATFGAGKFGGTSDAGLYFGGSGVVGGTTSVTYSYDPLLGAPLATIPEPAALGLLLAGVAGLVAIRRRA